MNTYRLQQLSYEEFIRIANPHTEGIPEKFTIDPDGHVIWWPTLGEDLMVNYITVRVGSKDNEHR